MCCFAGDDRAEDHHDIELQDEQGQVLARARLPEGIAGITRLHALIGQFAGPDTGPDEVVVGIETDRGLWVTALRAAGYAVYAINPRQVARYRERHGTSGAKSDKADAHTLADMVRIDARQLRPVAGDSPEAEAIKVAARAHQTMIWERTRQVQRLRHQLRDYFPAALAAFEDLDAPDALELLARAPDPARAARLTRAQVSAALKRAGRYLIADRADAIVAALRGGQLGQPPALTAAYAATVRSLIAVIITLNQQVSILQEQVEADFGRHPDAEVYRSQPGLGAILGARVPGEFGDDPHRYRDGKARRNYAATSPLTRASGKKKVVTARYVRNGRLVDALHARALRSPQGIARRPRPLRRAPRPRNRAQRRTAAGGEQARRHPPRMPQDPHPLHRGNRPGTPGQNHPIHPRRLTTKLLGCLVTRSAAWSVNGSLTCGISPSAARICALIGSWWLINGVPVDVLDPGCDGGHDAAAAAVVSSRPGCRMGMSCRCSLSRGRTRIQWSRRRSGRCTGPGRPSRRWR